MTSSTVSTLCFYIFGVSCLSAWNFFITPQSYWNAKFATHNSSSPNGTDLNPYQQFWDSSLSVAICGVQFTFCCIGTVLVNCFSRKCRFIFCFASLISLFLICAILAVVDTSANTELFFGTSLCIAVAMTILSSSLNITISIEATEFDQVAAFLSGQSMAGLIASISNILTTTLSNNIYYEALSFFVTASVIIAIGFASYIALYGCCDTKQKISEYDHLGEDVNNNLINSAENQPLLSPPSPTREITESYWSIFKTVWVEAICLVATFTITISVFPTLVSTFVPGDEIVSAKYFLPIFCFLNFNIFVLISFLGLTNGMNASVAFICGCSIVQPRSAPRAAAFLTICLTFGLTLGACSSFLVILAV